ncbi:hypothetical protein MNV49_002667 [Pseudohyphozyma bogoriensis]|nr:hypothetical protein MNV49_002667 [Pseudohyphozyma bogoriensis]
MNFKLTEATIHAIFEPTSRGEWDAFGEAIAPDVDWWIANDVPQDSLTARGVWNLQEWVQGVKEPLFKSLDVEAGIKMTASSIDIIGNKAIVEAYGDSVQKNGKPYVNKWCWILFFSEKTGKIVKIREYMDTAHVKEVMTSNGAFDV